MIHSSKIRRINAPTASVKFNLLDRTMEGSVILMLIYNVFLSLAVYLGYVEFTIKLAYEYWFFILPNIVCV